MAGGSRKRLRDVLQERQGEIMGRGSSGVGGGAGPYGGGMEDKETGVRVKSSHPLVDEIDKGGGGFANEIQNTRDAMEREYGSAVKMMRLHVGTFDKRGTYYMSAEGAVVAFDWNALTEHYGRKTAETKYKEKRKQASLAQKKYNDAIKKRNSIQGKISRLTRTNMSTSEEMPFF